MLGKGLTSLKNMRKEALLIIKTFLQSLNVAWFIKFKQEYTYKDEVNAIHIIPEIYIKGHPRKDGEPPIESPHLDLFDFMAYYGEWGVQIQDKQGDLRLFVPWQFYRAAIGKDLNITEPFTPIVGDLVL